MCCYIRCKQRIWCWYRWKSSTDENHCRQLLLVTLTINPEDLIDNLLRPGGTNLQVLQAKPCLAELPQLELWFTDDTITISVRTARI